jgi:hypothetical protein
MPEPSASSATEFQERLRALGFEVVLIGALAAMRYRLTPRATTDIDFLALSLTGLGLRLREQGFQVTETAEPNQEPYVLFARGSGWSVDVLRAETEYQRVAFDRAVDGALSVEDVIVHKLIAGRPRDADDIESILATGVALDQDYINRWAQEWAVIERWEKASGIQPEG